MMKQHPEQFGPSRGDSCLTAVFSLPTRDGSFLISHGELNEQE